GIRDFHVTGVQTCALPILSASVLDLGTLWPWDRTAVLADCARTGRLLVVHDAVQVGGFGAEVAATAAQATGCRVGRLGAPRIPVDRKSVVEGKREQRSGGL